MGFNGQIQALKLQICSFNGGIWPLKAPQICNNVIKFWPLLMKYLKKNRIEKMAKGRRRWRWRWRVTSLMKRMVEDEMENRKMISCGIGELKRAKELAGKWDSSVKRSKHVSYIPFPIFSPLLPFLIPFILCWWTKQLRNISVIVEQSRGFLGCPLVKERPRQEQRLVVIIHIWEAWFWERLQRRCFTFQKVNLRLVLFTRQIHGISLQRYSNPQDAL